MFKLIKSIFLTLLFIVGITFSMENTEPLVLRYFGYETPPVRLYLLMPADPTHADHRHDSQRHEGRPRALSRCRDGWLHLQAGKAADNVRGDCSRAGIRVTSFGRPREAGVKYAGCF